MTTLTMCITRIQDHLVCKLQTQRKQLGHHLDVSSHQISHFRTNGGRCVEDNVDNLSKEPVLVVRSGSHLANGPEGKSVVNVRWLWEKVSSNFGNSKAPLEACTAGVDSRKLSDVLCESFKEGASVLQRATLKLTTIPPTSPCR